MDNHIPNSKDLGGLIRGSRKQQGLTQDDLAGLTGVSRKFVSDVEKGKETAEIGKVLLIMGALGIALYALSKWKD